MDLRRSLADVAPHGVPLKKAWRAAIRATRDRRRRTGVDGVLRSQSSVERIRTIPLRSNVGEGELRATKEALSVLLDSVPGSEERDTALARLERHIDATLCSVHEGMVSVVLRGWPTCLSSKDLSRFLGREAGSLDAIPAVDAALLCRRIHGRVLAGSRIEARVELPSDTVLPAIPRASRNRSPRGRGALWLEVVDDESRISLTPEDIACSQSEIFARRVVIDAFGGVGGNALALAQSGHRVFMIEPIAARIEAARRNIGRRGLSSSVEFVHGRAEIEVPVLLRELGPVGLFLDPPWGGRDWNSDSVNYEVLLGRYVGMNRCIETADEVVLKLPRSFDVSTLPARAEDWHYRLEWGEPSAPPKMLTAWRLNCSDGPG